MALLLACARKIAFYDRLVRAGRWEVSPGKPIFRMAGSTLGLVGFGHTSRELAVRALAFGMHVLFYDPFVEEGKFDVRTTKVELNELLRESNFVSLHPPLVTQTRKMINDEALRQMKPTAFIINCSRGGHHRHRRAGARARCRGHRRLRARRHGSRAAAQSPSVAQPGQRDHHAACGLV
jgi:D-3-phosphoglycerate dehydrogenase